MLRGYWARSLKRNLLRVAKQIETTSIQDVTNSGIFGA